METASSASPNKSNGLAVISPRLASKSAREIAVRQWFVAFAELKREEFPKTFIDLWCEALSDLDPEWIEFGCRVYFRSMKFFPMPGDIREIVETEKESRSGLLLCSRFAPACEVQEIEHAIKESRRRNVPVSEILRDLREAKQQRE